MMLTGILKMSLRLKTSLYLLQALESSSPEQHSLPELYSPPEQCSPQEQQQIDPDLFSSDYDGSILNGLSDSSDDEKINQLFLEVAIDPTSGAETKLYVLG